MTGPLNTRRNRHADPIEHPERDARLWEGVRLFNEGHHWHAHEAWEPVWMGLEGQPKLWLQGLIMAAAMLHQYGRRVPGGVRNHWENVRMRLADPAERWGIDGAGLLRQLEPYAQDAAQDPPEFGRPLGAVRIAVRGSALS